jgi:ribonuclease P protein component
MIIKRNSVFSEILKNGKHISNPYFSIAFLDAQEVQIGFTCKKCTSACQRNRLKRLGRELARTSALFRTLPVKMILVMKETADPIPFQLLKSIFEELMVKIANKSQS